MPDEIDPQAQTANAEQAASAPAQQEPVQETEPAVTQEPAPGDETQADQAGSAPAEGEGKELPEGVREAINLRRRAQAAEQEAAYLRGRLESETAGKTQQQQGQQQTGDPKPDDFANYDDYLVAKAKHEVLKDMEAKQKDFREADKKAKVDSEYNKRFYDMAKKDPEAAMRVAQSRVMPQNPEIVYAIKESEAGPQIANYLAENPEEAIRLSQMSTASAIREVGKIESKLTMPKEQIPTKKVSLAPEPIAPTAAAGSQVSKNIYDLPVDEYIRQRNAQQVGK